MKLKIIILRKQSLHSAVPELDDFNLPCPSREKEMLGWFAPISKHLSPHVRAVNFLQPCANCTHHLKMRDAFPRTPTGTRAHQPQQFG
jgi:hypothetical protein